MTSLSVTSTIDQSQQNPEKVYSTVTLYKAANGIGTVRLTIPSFSVTLDRDRAVEIYTPNIYTYTHVQEGYPYSLSVSALQAGVVMNSASNPSPNPPNPPSPPPNAITFPGYTYRGRDRTPLCELSTEITIGSYYPQDSRFCFIRLLLNATDSNGVVAPAPIPAGYMLTIPETTFELNFNRIPVYTARIFGHNIRNPNGKTGDVAVNPSGVINFYYATNV